MIQIKRGILQKIEYTRSQIPIRWGSCFFPVEGCGFGAGLSAHELG